ncbi:MAG: AAA family ATPase [Prevotella sp.]|nr:AAA family ATPase [Prevotella sp.]
MKNIRINRIKLHNFKGIRDLDLTLNESAVILGGKNGYGKTTIFDALELLFTGKIARYSTYTEQFIDGRRAYSQEDRPLVCDQAVAEVSVEAYVTIVLDNGETAERIFTRKAQTAAMENPVKFNMFKGLKVREREADEPVAMTMEEWQNLGLSHFKQNYAKLNYMSQEEGTQFIKSKDSKRVEEVQFLFNTDHFDRRLNKIDHVLLKVVKDKEDGARAQKRQKEQTIQLLRQYGMDNAGEAIGYKKLFTGDVQMKWDGESPALSHEEYVQLLQEGGVMDQILLMISKQEEFRKHQWSVALNALLQEAGNYAFYLTYRTKADTIKQWRGFRQHTVEPFERQDLQHIATYQFVLDDGVKPLLEAERISNIEQMIAGVKQSYQLATQAQRAYNQLITQRNQLAQMVKESAARLEIKNCPLCGQSYETIEQLLAAIGETAGLQQATVGALNNQVAQAFERMKETIAGAIRDIDAHFGRNGVNADVVERYERLDTSKMERDVERLVNLGILTDMPKATMEETERFFVEALKSRIEAYDETLDYAQMKATFDTYVRYIAKADRTVENIQQKRAYLTGQWNTHKANQLKQLGKEVEALNSQLSQLGTLKNQLNGVRAAIMEQKNAYLKKVITDVEILFYVYSGRIMQDSFYGRGLFMKNVQGKYIYFVSKYSSDLDALYKMSSGQLVALMMALLLSLNKLYSESKLLAIDDPVQTIDDINVWGFVETLRHEFRDYQLLFSTHELSYGAFLRYKLSNMGIPAKYVDMMELRK